jgi:predicted RNA binding protein YcfA (HicA-like mRNA interferase family)
MPRLPRITAREARRAIERDGWYAVGTAGSHQQFKHATKAGRVTIPSHGSMTLDPRLLRSIIRQAGLTVEAFVALL